MNKEIKNNNNIQDYKKNIIHYFDAFQKLLKKGEEFGINLEELESKLSSAKENIQNGKIKVALVGGFSEGKTTLAAGWLGTIKDNMKIDPDESSDDIQIYRPKGFENDCEIIDTPGLYGNKKLENGTKFKELTLKYVSEAHLILFVLDPVNPIKDTHKETIKWLFRDLKKNNSVIFVLNKMDEVADLTDVEDFEEMFQIKKKNIQNSLERMIGLTSQEKEALIITAVSANPKEKGLEFWFKRNEDYLKRSRIGELRTLTNNVLSNSKESLIKNANLSIIQDVIIKQTTDSLPILNQFTKAINSRQETLEVLQKDYAFTEQKIIGIKAPLREELIAYKNELNNKFNGADISNFPQYISEEIGENAINFQSRISSIVERYVGEVNGLSNSLMKSFESEINFTENLLDKNNNVIKNGVKGLKTIPVQQWHGIINSSRHMLNGAFGTAIKFKPWGITKLAKGASGAIAGIGVAMEIYEMFTAYQKKEKLQKEKQEIINLVSNTIDEQLKILNDPETFMKTFAPNLQGLKEQINAINEAYNSVLRNKEKIEIWRGNVQNFSFENTKEIIEDVTHEEVN
ncbi:hypothetical protein G1K52_05165 [Tenacibaculum finnmarkense]|uniref:LeoA/HP0731 family dynamin-like GTPase n=1 Tax=Tenacibaculum finnmarkense TaxID=2781243 RepID=UPI001EFA497D|nr:LeoA/HP0731 family dynamin-like GTPase [Tenacibaculum finnmarkense]MCG8785152.1 hypothetical protein [Tenacibaculum finnmarkense]